MNCTAWIEALSAQADGEEPGIDPSLIDAHVARCAACRSFANSVETTRPRMLRPVDDTDLPRRVTRLVGAADRTSTSLVVRVALVGVALAIAAGAFSPLVLGDDGMGMGMSHMARHFGAMSMAYAVGLVVVAARPARARTLLPVSLVVAGALVITAVFDASEGRVTFLGEGKHLPEVAALFLVWTMTQPWSRRVADAQPDTDGLRAVGEDEGPRRAAG